MKAIELLILFICLLFYRWIKGERKEKMDRIEILMMMANKVVTEQNCVMEVTMGENSYLARLIPLEEQSDDEDEWEDVDE